MASDKLSKQRRVENELVFKRLNEQIKKAASTLIKSSQRDNFPLKFYCECSDEKCSARITLTMDEYAEKHKNVRNFIVLPGHQQPDIEEVVSEQKGYMVAKKDGELMEEALS